MKIPIRSIFKHKKLSITLLAVGQLVVAADLLVLVDCRVVETGERRRVVSTRDLAHDAVHARLRVELVVARRRVEQLGQDEHVRPRATSALRNELEHLCGRAVAVVDAQSVERGHERVDVALQQGQVVRVLEVEAQQVGPDDQLATQQHLSRE